MWTEINGERKKIACGPCIRGHRSSKCDHKDRVLVEVRKPGRPLSSCPHPSGSCSCERVVVNYTIPKTSECACPSDQPSSSGTPISNGTGNRVQKPKPRKSVSAVNPAAIERAIKASQTPELDASSQCSKTPAASSLASSENSNGGSPPSSTSSTPRMGPVSPQRQAHDVDMRMSSVTSDDQTQIQSVAAGYQTLAAKPSVESAVSDCCNPSPVRRDIDQKQAQTISGCCGNKLKEPPKPLPQKKSCCGGPRRDTQPSTSSRAGIQEKPMSNISLGQPFPFNGYYQAPLDSLGVSRPLPVGHALSYAPSQPGIPLGNVGMSNGYRGFNDPISTSGTLYHQSPVMGMTPNHRMSVANDTNSVTHNCHCGDNCTCFGCAEHPRNETTTQWVLSMVEGMRTDQWSSQALAYDTPSYPHQPVYAPQASHSTRFGYNAQQAVDLHSVPPQTMPYQMNANGHQLVNGLWSQSGLQASVQSPMSAQPTPTNAFRHIDWNDKFQGQQLATRGLEDTVSSPKEENDNEDTPTLSPSTFLWQEMVLPGCNDASGTCQCGDGCECVGCLTHGGHNGIPLEPTPTGNENGLPQFLSDPPEAIGIEHDPYATDSYMNGLT